MKLPNKDPQQKVAIAHKASEWRQRCSELNFERWNNVRLTGCVASILFERNGSKKSFKREMNENLFRMGTRGLFGVEKNFDQESVPYYYIFKIIPWSIVFCLILSSNLQDRSFIREGIKNKRVLPRSE